MKVKLILKRGILFILLFILLAGSQILLAENLQTLQPGKLIIGTYFTNPPLEFVHNNKEVGFEVDLMNEIAKRLELKPIYINTVWEKIVEQLSASKYDVIMGGITLTPLREKIVPYTNPYIITTLSILINEKQSPKIRSINDLRNQIVGVQAKTTDYDIALQMWHQKKIKDIKVYPFANFREAISDLLAGKIGAVMKVYPVATYYTQLYPQLYILAEVANDPQPLGFGINPYNKTLLMTINKTQAEIKADGTYQKIYQKWFKNNKKGHIEGN